jgi:pimeloyl-ACP methyl ester carboxylesterase
VSGQLPVPVEDACRVAGGDDARNGIGPPTPSVFPVFRTRPVTATEAGTLTCPVLVVGGTEDPLFSAAEMTEVASLFPNSQLELFKGAGHLAYYERPRRFNDLARAFLGKKPS